MVKPSPRKAPLRAGAAAIDITPAKGVHMGGDLCRLRPVEEVLDPIYARALVLEQGTTRACLLALDLCTPGNDVADDIRAQVAARCGIPAEAIVFHLLQNHSAPSLGTHLLLRPDSPCVRPDFWWVYKGDDRYVEFLVPKVLEVVEEAIAKLEPVAVGCGGMADARVAFNRRFVMRDGWVCTQPQDPAEILHSEGPADPEVGVACFRNADGEIVAALLHHTAHPVSHFGEPVVTASWPGAWVRQLGAVVGPRCVPIVINGCCGNVNPVNHADPRPRTDDEQIGRYLTETARKVLDRMTWQEHAELGFASNTLQIPFSRTRDVLGDAAIERARAIVAAEPEPRWANEEHTRLDIEWLFAAATVDMERRTRAGTYSYEIQTARVGDLALAGLIGEPFVEGQLAIKLKSPAARTFVAHMCNGWVGYIPTRHGYHARNYNFRTPDGRPVLRGANLFFLAPDALDRITTETLRLLQTLWVSGHR